MWGTSNPDNTMLVLKIVLLLQCRILPPLGLCWASGKSLALSDDQTSTATIIILIMIIANRNRNHIKSIHMQFEIIIVLFMITVFSATILL